MLTQPCRLVDAIGHSMAVWLRIKDGYMRIWISFLYLLCDLFGRFICSKSGLQLSVDGYIILFDNRHRGAYWRRISLPAFQSRTSPLA